MALLFMYCYFLKFSHLSRSLFFKSCHLFIFQIEFKFAECVTDLQLVGAKFVHNAGRAFCVTGYDNSDLIFFVQ